MIKIKNNNYCDLFYAFFCCIITFITFMAVNSPVLHVEKLTVNLLMQITVIIFLVGAYWMHAFFPEINRAKIGIYLILSLGIIMRVGYMLYTPASLRGHDLGSIDVNGYGHAAYIIHLFNGSLPNNVLGQFYHPPLFHTMAAMTMRLYQAITNTDDLNIIFESAKTVSCYASIFSLLYVRKICCEINLTDRATLIALALTAFLPNHYMLAGRVNNDSLLVFFMTAIIFYTLNWYHTRNLIVLMKLGICFGLGMMTKISVSVFAAVTGGVMLYVLRESFSKGTFNKIVQHYCYFALIAFPLGLWYPFYKYMLYHQAFSYILIPGPMDTSNPLYCGNHALWERLGIIWSNSIYNNPFGDYNIWNYTLRGGLFGEFQFQMGVIIPSLLLTLNFTLVIASIIYGIITLHDRNTDSWIIFAFWCVLVVSYAIFNIKYPFGCTMDFRYIVPTATIGALFIAKGHDLLSSSSIRASFLFNKGINITVVFFSLVSIVMFCNV